ncbi:MAG: cell division protein DedD, partial [Candidatus Thiodiazotropha taylori]|nr:cell division protein DedD [Candidatus Thiodiazotropha taylori]MCW4252577.1 cell division protein DedD [Candidatus Thiodiazotropha taylori]
MTKWDTRFLGLAAYISAWSKDPSSQVGAVITD